MNILFVSEDLVAGNLAYILKKEGHSVKLYIKDKRRRKNFSGLVEKIPDWRKELDWVRKDGLIVFDSGSHGKTQESLRKQGYLVFGGCKLGDRIESDRTYGADVFSRFGMKTAPLCDFENSNSAVRFLKKRRGPWVLKQNVAGTGLKSLNYVGMREDNRDMIDLFSHYQKRGFLKKSKSLTLQERIFGVEMGVGRFFNGKEWTGPIEINLEHKKFFPGDLGPSTSEMGTLAWYDENESNKLFSETLAKLKPYLRKIGFHGDAELNCIVNEKGAFPLEATMRFGSPIIHLQTEIHESPWGNFLQSVAKTKEYDLKWKKGYGIVVVVTVPTSNPFPFSKNESYVSPEGLNIYFDERLNKNDMKHVHFEDVSLKKKGGLDQFYISDSRGYILYVTGIGKTVAEARTKVNSILKKIQIPKMFYRNDIGLKFLDRDQSRLKKWGYL